MIRLRYVGKKLEIDQGVIGLHPLSSTNGEDLFLILNYVLYCYGLKVSEGKGQCYDGAATMMGAEYDVA